MMARWRSMALVVVMFTALAVAMVWGLSLQLQNKMQERMLAQAEARAQQLADAMAGQTQAYVRLMDMMLLDLRVRWVSDQAGFEALARRSLDGLPAGMVTHVAVVDAQGQAVLDVPGPLVPRTMADRAHFQQLGQGGDRLVMGEPVLGRRHGLWVMAVGRPILRDGHFDGAVYLLVSTDFIARSLARLTLTPQDIVALVHPGGRILARSRDNAQAMQQTLPTSRPFLRDPGTRSGSFREAGAVDQVPRLFGWLRLPDTGVVAVVGLSEAGVLEPLAQARRDAMLLTALLSLALAGIGAWIGWLQWRLESGEAERRRSREQLQEAQRTAQLGHWSFDSRSGAMTWSDEVYRIFGQDPAQFQPGFEAYWKQVYPDEKGRLQKLFDGAMADRTDLDDVHRIVRPDGSERHVRLICRTEPGHRGTSFRGTLQDVTELRQTQLALQKLNSGLEQRVKTRTRELRELNQELESFTYSVSHDLRTPLRSIHGFATLLQESEASRLSVEGRDFLRRIQESSRRMGLLITDLLSMAQHSRAEIHPQWVDLSALAWQVVGELERGEPQRQVRWDIEPGLRVQADPTLMRVVLQNLLGNAWKYTGHTADARIGLRSAPAVANGQLGFCVQDNGAGFDMAYAGQLFQPFKRLHAHQEFEGTGIGLATVARVLQRHGGSIRGEGAVGQGATFCFSLPIEPLRQFADSGVNAA